MDKRVFALGITMLAVGFGIYGYLSENEPAGKSDMTDEEKVCIQPRSCVKCRIQKHGRTSRRLGIFHHTNQHRNSWKEERRYRKNSYAKTSRDLKCF